MSFAAMMGGWVIAFPWVGGPATIGHCMSEALGPRFGIPHGFACAIMLPQAMVSLQNPECKKGKKTDRLLGIILFYVNPIL